jgi:hypothetical protein
VEGGGEVPADACSAVAPEAVELFVPEAVLDPEPVEVDDPLEASPVEVLPLTELEVTTGAPGVVALVELVPSPVPVLEAEVSVDARLPPRRDFAVRLAGTGLTGAAGAADGSALAVAWYTATAGTATLSDDGSAGAATV